MSLGSTKDCRPFHLPDGYDDAVPLGRVVERAKEKHAKPRMSLLPGAALRAVAEVMTFGALKYDDDSWKRAPFTKADYLDAQQRHVAAISEGELYDPESGLLHAAHMACCSLFYLWHQLREGK